MRLLNEPSSHNPETLNLDYINYLIKPYTYREVYLAISFSVSFSLFFVRFIDILFFDYHPVFFYKPTKVYILPIRLLYQFIIHSFTFVKFEGTLKIALLSMDYIKYDAKKVNIVSLSQSTYV